MLRTFYIFAFSCLVLLAAASQAPAAESEGVRIAKALSGAYAEISARVKPSVVAIEVTREIAADGEEELDQLPFNVPPEMKKYFKQKMRQQRGRNAPQGMGSGIIIDAKGIILTNNHVVKDSSKIKITIDDGTFYDAEVVGTDPKSDVAVIKISKPDRAFSPAVLGDSDTVKVGNIVLAIGAPFGLKESVTNGIVSAINRSRIGGGGDLGELMYKNFIQTDATINPGNSGGPLVNLDGEVIGINSAISTASMGSDGVGFAIPANMAKEIIKELLEKGSVTRGWLGVSISDFTPEMVAALPDVKSGVMVLQIFPNTPAEKGGLKFGDIMLTYNGTVLKDAGHLQNLVARTPVGESAKVEILRGNEKMTLSVPIGRQPKKLRNGQVPEQDADPATPDKAKTSSYVSKLLGLDVIELANASAEEKEAYKGQSGVVVNDILPNSPAEEAGLAKGALIMLVNLKKISSIAELQAAEKDLVGKTAALLHFRMGDQPAVTTLDLTVSAKGAEKGGEAPKAE